MSSTVRNFAYPVRRRRYGPQATNADGFPVGAVVQTDRILMHAHPANGEQLQRMPDGLEPVNTHQGYTPAQLQLGNRETGQRPDVIEIDGTTFEVVEVSPWSGGRTGRQSWRQCLLNEVRR